MKSENANGGLQQYDVVRNIRRASDHLLADLRDALFLQATRLLRRLLVARQPLGRPAA